MTGAFCCNFKTSFSVLDLRISVSYTSTKGNCWEYTFDTVRRHLTLSENMFPLCFDSGLRVFFSSAAVSLDSQWTHGRVKINFAKAFFELKNIKARSLPLAIEI